MLELFGNPVSLSEILTFLGFFSLIVGTYYSLSGQLTQITERNDLRDKSQENLEQKVLMVDAKMIAELNALKSTMDTKIFATEERLRAQDVFLGRLDERLSSMTSQLDKVIDLVQQKGTK